MRTVPALVLATLVVTAGGALAGCGSSSSGSAVAAADTAVTPAGSSGSASSQSTGTSTAATGSGGDVNACTLLSVAMASSLTGTHYSGSTPHTLAPGQDQCAYSNADGFGLTITVYQPSSGLTYAQMVSVLAGTVGIGTSPVTLSGIGDQATVGGDEIDVQVGSRLVAIAGAGGTLPSTGGYAGATKVAKTIVAELGS